MPKRRRKRAWATPHQGVEVSCSEAELSRATRELAIRLLTEGMEQGEDRRRWEIDVRDENGDVVLTLTLAEAADGSGLVNLH